MQSKNYIPGVSGWKMHKDGRLEIEGVVRVAVTPSADEKPQHLPFIVVDGVTYISAAEVERGTIAKLKVNVELRDGKYVSTGFNIGVDNLEAAQAPEPKSVEAALNELAEKLTQTEFLSQFTVQARAFEDAQAERTASDYAIAARIGAVEARLNDPAHLKEVIRQALEPGGLIHKAIRAAR